MIRYTRLIDSQNWPATAYPSGSFCVVMVDDDSGEIVADPFYQHVEYQVDGTPDLFFGNVYDRDGVFIGSITVDSDASYGALYDSIEDLLNNVTSDQRLDARIREEMNDNQAIRREVGDQQARRLRAWILIGLIVIPAAIVISYFIFAHLLRGGL